MKRNAPRPVNPSNNDDEMRLAKRMATLGMCSRREADEYILQGLVTVNGETITQKGYKVLPTDKISMKSQAVAKQNNRVTILLNKPVGYVSGQAEKGYIPASMLIKSENRWKEDKSAIAFHPSHERTVAPAGRLDIDSNGLLVLTQDGRVAKLLIGNENKIEKEYLVRVSGQLSDKGLQLLNYGLKLDGELLKPAKVTWQNADQLKFILRQGKKRQIRRMCELVGLKVIGLKRVRIGKVTLGNLPVGKWRYLAPGESF